MAKKEPLKVITKIVRADGIIRAPLIKDIVG